ncbi:MAG: tetratricopeptide repeat protein [Bacteroidota bacterium]
MRKLLSLFVVLMAVGFACTAESSADVPSSETAPAPESDFDMEAARKMHESGDLIGARAAYDEILQQNPGDIAALGNRAILLESRNDIAGALQDYDQLLRLEPDNVPALAHRAALRARTGREKEAIEDYDALVALRPEDPLVRNDRGSAHFNLGNNEQALADFGAALSLAPQLTPALLNQGHVHFAEGRLAEAAFAYQKALVREPENVEALVAMGNYFWGAGPELDSAETYFQRAVALDPKSGAGWLGIGNVRFSREDLPGAIAAFDRGINADGDNLELRMNRGLAHYRSRTYAAAIADYDAVLAQSPGLGRALAMRGYARCESGDLDRGCQDFTTARSSGVADLESAIFRYCR